MPKLGDVEARRAAAQAEVDAQIAAAVESAPPLSPQVMARLRQIFQAAEARTVRSAA